MKKPCTSQRLTMLGLGLVVLGLFLTGPLLAAEKKTDGGKPQGKTPSQTSAQPVPSGQWLPDKVPPFDPGSSEYLLSAWSDVSLRQMSDCDALFSLSAPFATLRAALVKRGPAPQTLTEGVIISYTVEGMEKASARSKYFALSEPLAGTKLQPDVGPTGNGQRGQMKPSEGMFTADQLPVMPYAADGSYLPYPTVRLEARDAASGKILAVTRTTLPVSTEYNCARCHGGASGKPGISPETATAILTAHDKLSGTKLLAEAKAGKPRACASCHDDARKDASMSLSASMHGFHAAKLAGQGAEACANCHPAGPASIVARDHHQARGVDCARCHGTMEQNAAALLAYEQQTGKKTAAKLLAALPGKPDVAPRMAHAQQPACSACHDFSARPVAAQASAVGRWTKPDEPAFAMRKDMSGGLPCAACHSTVHALYPSNDPYGRDRDALVAVQYQGLNAPLGAQNHCGACHVTAMDPSASVHHPIPAKVGTLVSLPENFKPTKPRVLMPHKEHATLDCRTCHHTGYADNKTMRCSSPGCHEQTVATPGDARFFRNAFHGPGNSCMGCHQAQKKDAKPYGPVDCAGCHTVR